MREPGPAEHRKGTYMYIPAPQRWKGIVVHLGQMDQMDQIDLIYIIYQIDQIYQLDSLEPKLLLRDVVQGTYRTDPNQETCATVDHEGCTAATR